MRCNVRVWFETECALQIRTSLDSTDQFLLCPAGKRYRVFADILAMHDNKAGLTNLPALVVQIGEDWNVRKAYEVQVRHPGTHTVITLDNAGVLRTRLDVWMACYQEEVA
jgi:hypothetical protein